MYKVTKTYYRDPNYFIRILISLDELGASILKLPNDVTISSACGKWKDFYGFKRFIAHTGYLCLDWIKVGHCEGAIIHDEERAQDAISYLEDK